MNQASSNPVTWDSQPLPAYQYFENVRNFLVAIEQLKLPAFDASIFERVKLKMVLLHFLIMFICLFSN